MCEIVSHFLKFPLANTLRKKKRYTKIIQHDQVGFIQGMQA